MHKKTSLVVVPLIFLFCLCGAGTAVGQDIFQKEQGLYSTIAIVDTLAIGASERISIKTVDALVGSITIGVAQQDHILITYFKQARTESRSRAVDYIDLITVSSRLAQDEVRLELRAPNPPPWDGTAETGVVGLEIVLPVDFNVEIDATYFDVVAEGPLKSFVAAPSLGLFDVSMVDGELEVATKNRRVKLADISGTISASTTKSSMTVVNAESGTETATFRNDGGDIKIDGFTGEASIRNEFGRTDIRRFTVRGDGNYIRGSSRPITIELTSQSRGALVVRNRYEDINITVPDTVSASFILSVDDDGEIEVANMPFTVDLVEKNQLNLTCGSGDVEVIGSIKGKGNIWVNGVEGE